MASQAQSLEFSELSLAGVALLSSLHREIFPADTGERWQPQDLAAILSQPTTLCLLAQLDEMPAGYALLRFIADECELLSFGVRPELRRQGIAGRLLDHSLAVCRGRGASRFFLEVREDNLPARRFYAEKGFASIGRRPGYYRGSMGQKTDAITMAFDLI